MRLAGTTTEHLQDGRSVMTSSMPICCRRRRSVENCRAAVPSMPLTRLREHTHQGTNRGESSTSIREGERGALSKLRGVNGNDLATLLCGSQLIDNSTPMLAV